MSKHTPTAGDWNVETWNYSPSAIRVENHRHKELVIVTPRILIATVQCNFTRKNPYEVPFDEAMTNARLMTAAKVLKEALEGMLRICQGDSGTGESYWQTIPEYVAARAALAATEEG